MGFFMHRGMPRLVLVALVLCVIGCEKSAEQARAEHIASLPEDQKLSFVVDQPGIRYLYRTGDGGTRSVLSLAAVPPGYRAAVAVFAGGKANKRATEDELFVADLVSASAGDEVIAVLESREHMDTISSVGALGAGVALSVVDEAGWMIDLTPGRDPKPGRYVSFIIEDGQTGATSEKATYIKRGIRKPREEELEEEDEDLLEDAWDRVFGDDAEGEQEVEGGASWERVTMYSTAWCPACKTARAWLEKNNIPHRYVDVERDPRGGEQMREACAKRGVKAGAVPTFVIGDQGAVMQGWNRERFIGMARK